MSGTKAIYQRYNQDSIGFGKKDLILHIDGGWTSQIEGVYTTGDLISTPERSTFLAGKGEFIPDKLEVWAIDYSI